MKRSIGWFLFLLFVLIALVTSTLATNDPLISQVDPTTQRQTVDAAVAERLGPTATAQAVATATATIDAAMQSAVSATAQAQATQAAEATLVEVAIQTAVQQSIEATFVPVTRNADWTPIEREFGGGMMVLVPVGSFVMGSTAEEIDAAIALCNESDRDNNCLRDWFSHEARNGDNTQTFTEPFWFDKYEVTRRRYQACVDAGACTAPPASDFSTEPEQPINRVTWFEAQAYCEWTGGRLPTEAEWEYAARGPDGLLYPWGNTSVIAEANHCDGNCAASGASNNRFTSPENDDGHAVTAPVGSYPQGASWVGALDMSGNVWEWTNSLYEPYPYAVDDGRERDTGSDTNVSRVLRGGSFYNTSFVMRASNRNRTNPSFEIYGLGFRCARSQ